MVGNSRCRTSDSFANRATTSRFCRPAAYRLQLPSAGVNEERSYLSGVAPGPTVTRQCKLSLRSTGQASCGRVPSGTNSSTISPTVCGICMQLRPPMAVPSLKPFRRTAMGPPEALSTRSVGIHKSERLARATLEIGAEPSSPPWTPSKRADPPAVEHALKNKIRNTASGTLPPPPIIHFLVVPAPTQGRPHPRPPDRAKTSFKIWARHGRLSGKADAQRRSETARGTMTLNCPRSRSPPPSTSPNHLPRLYRYNIPL